jgi:two-component system cell cycle response regulator DivK
MTQRSILLVDAAQDDRTMYAEFLRANHFNTLESDTTDDALQAALAADVIVTGIRVPGSFDGIELVKRLRGDQRTSRRPLIVLSACVFELDQRRALAAGCDVFLPKPCLPNRLLAEVRTVLARSRQLQVRGQRGTARTAKARLKPKALLDESASLAKHDRKRKQR